MYFKTTVTDKNVYKRYVEVLNSLFGLSEREMDVFANLVRIQLEWGDKEYIDVIDTRSRKDIMRETYINKNNLTKYLKVLREKNILIDTQRGVEVNPSLLPNLDNDIEITFILSKNEN